MDALLESDLMTIVNGTKTPVEGLPDNDFRKVFWEQQVTALSKRGTQAVRWHPLFVRWCLNVMLSSPKTYNIIRDSGMLVLSSQRTLKDYSNWFKAKLGYQSEVFQQLAEDYKVFEFNDAQRHVMLAFDEMKVKEGLVFDHTTGSVIGYADTGDMNSMLKSFEAEITGKLMKRDIATHMLAVCVRGIFINLDYPLGQFSTTAVSANDLYSIIWTAIRKLKEIGLEVVLVVADGMSNNRKFFKLHKSSDCMRDGIVYKVRNIYDPNKHIWFMSDVCHLLKTTRNCWESSKKNGTRHLEVYSRSII
jgi:hypothetical protein